MAEPEMYRGWEIHHETDWMPVQAGAEWDAYKGGVDLGAPRISGRTLEQVKAEIDDAVEEERDKLQSQLAEMTRSRNEWQRAAGRYQAEMRTANETNYQFQWSDSLAGLLRIVADEIDCGNDCSHGHTESSTNAFVCRLLEKTEGCQFDKASQLRDFATAIEARNKMELPPLAVENESLRLAVRQALVVYDEVGRLDALLPGEVIHAMGASAETAKELGIELTEKEN